MDVVAEQCSAIIVRIRDDSCIHGGGHDNRGMRPILLALCPSANEVGNNQASAKEHDGAVEKDLQALVVAQMEAGDSDIPEESEHRTANENYDTGSIFRSCASVSGLVIIRTHRLLPSEK